jgi:hypothetical protein
MANFNKIKLSTNPDKFRPEDRVEFYNKMRSQRLRAAFKIHPYGSAPLSKKAWEEATGGK